MFTKDMLLIDAFRTEGINIDAMATVLADMGMMASKAPVWE